MATLRWYSFSICSWTRSSTSMSDFILRSEILSHRVCRWQGCQAQEN
jgi:hypothetical protein